MRILFLFIFSFLFLTCKSQDLIIATDYNNCTQGVKDESGNWVVQPLYDYIENAYKGTFIVNVNGKAGVVDKNGRILIPLIYTAVSTGTGEEDLWSDWDGGYNSSAYFFVVWQENKSGVADTTGKIIVPLDYKTILICEDGNIIASKNDKRWSFFSSSGEEFRIKGRHHDPPNYLENNLFKITRNIAAIDWFYSSLFDICLAERSGVIDGKGNKILPEKFTEIDFRQDSFAVIIAERKNKIGYYSPEGKALIPMRTENYHVDPSKFFQSRMQDRVASTGYLPLVTESRKWGILSLKGDTLLPFVYTDLNWLQVPHYFNKNHSLFIVTKDSLKGCFSPENGWTIPIQYEDIRVLAHLDFYGDSSQEEILAVKKSGKWGALSTAGDVILPFQYDSVYCMTPDQFLFSDGDKLLVMAFPNNLKTNFNYDSTSLSSLRTNHHLNKSSEQDGISFYTIPSLSITMAYKYNFDKGKRMDTDSILNADTKSRKTIMAIYPVNNFISLSDSGELCQIFEPNLYTFKNEDSLFLYRKKKSNNQKIIYQPVISSFSENGNEYLVTNKGKIIVNKKIAFRTESTVYGIEGVQSDDGKPYFKMSRGYEGILDSTGKIFVDFSFQDISNFNSEYVWVMGENREGFHNKYNNFGWNIYSISEKKIILPVNYYSHRPAVISNGFTVVNTSKGIGLYDLTNRKFSVAPKYDALLKLDKVGNYYAVRTSSGKIGIFSKEGILISDTAWVAITSCTLPEPGKERKYSGYYDFIVLFNSNAHVIFETASGKIIADSSAQHLLFITTLLPKISLWPKYFSDFTNFDPFLTTDTSLSNVNYKLWQEKILFDSLYMPQLPTSSFGSSYSYSGSSRTYRQNNYRWSKDEDKFAKYFVLMYINDSVLSLKRKVSSYYNSSEADFFINTFLYSDGPHPVFLDSLLTGDWKNFITNEVMSYVNSNLNVRGDCHNPAAIPMLLNNRFILTQKGMFLYPPGFSENNYQLIIFIPWEKLKPYLRKDAASKIGLK